MTSRIYPISWESCWNEDQVLIILSTHLCFLFLLMYFWLLKVPLALEELHSICLLSCCHVNLSTKGEAEISSFIFYLFCCAGKSTSSTFILPPTKEHGLVQVHQGSSFIYWHLFQLVFDSIPKH